MHRRCHKAKHQNLMALFLNIGIINNPPEDEPHSIAVLWPNYQLRLLDLMMVISVVPNFD